MSPQTPSMGKVDLSTLSSHLRIIPTSPAWPTVQAAITNLERSRDSGQSNPSLVSDTRCLAEYALLLTKSAGMIADALVCGLVVGKAARVKGRGQEILVGLDAISRAHRFTEKTDIEVGQIFTALLGKIRARFPALLVNYTSPIVTELHPRDWQQGVEPTLAHVDDSTLFADADLDKVHESAWGSWLQRMDLFFKGERRPEPELNDLFALAAQSKAAVLLKLDLREMTVSDWSAALMASLTGLPRVPASYCPPWVGVAALLALGYRVASWPQLVDWAKHWPLDAKDLEVAGQRLEVWSRSSSPPPSRAILILKRTSASLVDAWVPSTGAAAAVVNAEQTSSLLEVLGKEVTRPPLLPPPGLVAFEMPLEKDKLDAEALNFLQKLMGTTVAPVYFYAQAPRSATPGSYVIAPKSVDELFPTAPLTA
jgi:hypothetical protein